MSTASTEILRDAYMGRLTSIRTVQLLAGMDNLTAARRCCVSPHTFRRWRCDRRPNPTALRLETLAVPSTDIVRDFVSSASPSSAASG